MRTSLVVATVVLIGLVLVIAVLTGRWPPIPGRLPGDLRIEGESSTFVFPITTCLLISLLLSLALNFGLRWFR